MKLNHKELSSLLQTNGIITDWFYISVYEFAAERKPSDWEQYVRRWCLLENNVLLTSKHEHGALETAVLLENYQVELCQSKSHGYGMKLDFHNSEYHMYCSSKETAEKWVECIRDRGYMSLLRQWKGLQEEYNTLLAQQNRISKCFGSEEFPIPTDSSKEVVVSCDLPPNSPTQNTFASMYFLKFERWFLRYQTENVDHTLNPHYSKTFHFEMTNNQLDEDTPLKFCINNMTTGTVLGYVNCVLRDIQSAKDSKLVCSLRDDKGNDNVGEVTLELSTSSHNSLPTSHRSLLQIVSNSDHFTLDCHRGFMFQTNYEKIHVSEQLWDHRSSITFPLEYVKFLLSKKECILSSYEEFTTLDPMYDPMIAQLLTHHETSLLNLLRAKSFLEKYDGPLFRKSILKKESEWQYCPVNLAVYALGVCDCEEKESNYFTTTVGAFSSHALGYKQSLQASLVTAQKNSLYSARHDKLMTSINELYEIWEDIDQYKQTLIDAIALEHTDLYDIAVSLTTKISDLTEFCKRSEIVVGTQMMNQAESCCSYSAMRERNWSTPEADYVFDGERYREKSLSRTSSVNCQTDSKQETETDITLAITAFILAIEKKGNTIGRDMLKMLASLEPLVTQSRQGLMFMLLLEENKIFNSFFSFNPDIEMRMNHSFSQGLTCLYSTFYISLLDAYTRDDFSYFVILENIGFLVQFQSLLSTYGQELTMLEDHWITINSLIRCSFVLTPGELGEFSLSGLSYNVTISLGVGSQIWAMLPLGLKQGKSIQVNSMLFSKGVNEQQMLAEKVGNTDMQHTINIDGLCKLEVYFMIYREYVSQNNVPAELARLEGLMSLISKHVRSRTPKDVQLLSFVDEAVRLMSGSRVTSCKSAKDRTAMSVTYESVCMLSRNHSLVSSSFNNALAAIRSHGVRPLNCKKNTGNSKYAFNSFQVKILPKEYVPPIGTYGGKIT